jgi:predicted metal-dependent phosphoesterase TrpH
MNRELTEYVDLHIHSTYSDGALTPAEIVREAERAGLKAVGITDHDSVDGLEIARIEGKKSGIEVVGGVEMSVSTMDLDVHHIGYFVDPNGSELRRYLEFFKETRLDRAHRMVKRLNELGVDLNLDTVLGIGGEGSIGRMHIAKALVREKLCPTIDAAFGRYLRDGGPAFVEKYRMSAEKAIRVIHEAGGVAVLAHPGFYSNEELMNHLFDVGLDGLEVYNPKHTEIQILRFQQIVQDHKGVGSGGSDFHGGRDNASPLGSFKVPYSVMTRMVEYHSGIHAVG